MYLKHEQEIPTSRFDILSILLEKPISLQFNPFGFSNFKKGNEFWIIIHVSLYTTTRMVF